MEAFYIFMHIMQIALHSFNEKAQNSFIQNYCQAFMNDFKCDENMVALKDHLFYLHENYAHSAL